MLDPLQLPILLKAIDFVFDEGRKILQERRERRKASQNAPKEDSSELETEVAVLEPEKAREIIQDLQSSKVDEYIWLDHESEVQHLTRLLETHSRNYHLTKEQYAKWGSALVPPIIVHNMTEAENAMMDTLGKLETVLSKVYGRDINLYQ